MKKFSPIKFKTKKGAASFYVVIFATLILSVITLSFIRITLNEATRTTDSDLSQSAYDSALAGVEDAKTALLKSGYGAFKNPTECNGFVDSLYQGHGTSEVKLSEDTRADSSSEDQAYTCVKIQDTLSDYRATLSQSLRIKVIPLNVTQGQIDSIEVNWYSANNRPDTNKLYSTTNPSPISLLQEKKDQMYFNSTGVASDARNDRIVPPVLSAALVQTDDTFTYGQLKQDGQAADGTYKTDRGLAVLYPVKKGGTNNISGAAIGETSNSDKSHNAFYIQCSDSDEKEFACTTTIELPRTATGSNTHKNAFLILALPYSQADVDIMVRALYNGNVIDFQGVQYEVDSTGRANDIYRRVDTRIELGNIHFPYPEYAVQAGFPDSSGEDAISKNFWVTNSGWATVCELRSEGCDYKTENRSTSGEVK